VKAVYQEKLEQEGISAEGIDLRTLMPIAYSQDIEMAQIPNADTITARARALNSY
jgi:pyruvate/2-oxoglutarate/acetoin dehydrogenase E1 component